MSDTYKGVFLHSAYTAYLKDVAVAILCSQIHYWYSPSKKGQSKLCVVKDSKLWIAKSRREWSEETGLTDAQVKRAIDVLEESKVIEKMIAKFNGAPTMHVRALRVQGNMLKDGEFLVPILTKKNCITQNANPFGVDAQSSGLYAQSLVTDDQSITETLQENSTETTHNSLASSDAGITKTEKPKQTPEEIKHNDVVNWPTKKNQIDFASSVSHNGTVPLHECWNQLTVQYADKYGEYLPPDKKELAQLRQISQTLGVRAEPVLKQIFEDWISFTKSAHEKFGAYSIPQLPSIGFILKYQQAALHFWKASSSPKTVGTPTGPNEKWHSQNKAEAEQIKGVAAPSGNELSSLQHSPKTVKPVEEEETPATLEQVKVILKTKDVSEKPKFLVLGGWQPSK